MQEGADKIELVENIQYFKVSYLCLLSLLQFSF